MHSFNIKHTLDLIWVTANFNLRSEASENYLSYAWWIIEPLLHMMVFYVVFALLLNRGGENYIVFLLVGLIPWLWFSKSIVHTQHSIVRGKQLMNQLYIPKLFFPLTVVLQDAIKQLIVFALLLSFLFFYGILPTLTWFWILPVILAQLLLIISCSLFVAIIVPYIRDLSLVIPTILQFMMFGSGIFYSYKDIPVQYHDLFFFNPMAVIMHSFRLILIEHVRPDFGQLYFVAGLSILFIIIGVMIYRRLEYTLPRVVLE